MVKTCKYQKIFHFETKKDETQNEYRFEARKRKGTL
jgi:hypothetical protein